MAEPGAAQADPSGVEVSIVMPCLNEAATLEGCIREARECLAALGAASGAAGEVVVADNGSSDGSQEIARRCGARVVAVGEKGYGAALAAGIEAARGRFVIMGDSDLSYDFREGERLVARLREGFDLVMGSRFKGAIRPGAMPVLHRWLGNPVLSFLGRVLFRVPVSDFHCGLRGFRRDAIRSLNLRTTGMEFASEMVVKARLRGLRIAEVPVTLRPDGRGRPPHLRTWRDGWRHLRFMLCLSPRWTLGVPGLVLGGAGAVLGALVMAGPLRVMGVTLDVHTLVAASLMTIVGYQMVTVAAAMRIFALVEELGPAPPGVERLFRVFTLERGLMAGLVVGAAGLAMIGLTVGEWAGAGFGDLPAQRTLRPMIAGSTLSALGVQTVLMSFVYSMMGIRRRGAGGSGGGAA